MVSWKEMERPYFFPNIPEKNQKEYDPVLAIAGRYLFYDPILSRDSTRSCSSCHQQEYAFADNSKFSEGIEKKAVPRNSLALFNLQWYEAFFWDGRATSLEAQINHPITDQNELNSSWELILSRLNNSPLYKKLFEDYGSQIDSQMVVNAIGQFERRLISANSKYDQVLNGKTYYNEDEYAGFLLVNDQTKGNCLHCHTSDANALGTIGTFSNNGLDAAKSSADFADKGVGGVSKKELDMGKFKIPSFRNLVFTAPYMHDGRFKTLEEVVDFYADEVQNNYSIDPKMEAHLGKKDLSRKEREQIVAFLKTMSDSSFVADTSLSNPF